MQVTIKIARYTLLDLLYNRVTLFYTLFLMGVSVVVFNLDDNVSKGILSLVNIILLIVPLVSIVFATIHMYNSAEFIELLLARPIQRTRILFGHFVGISTALSTAFLIGIGLPVLLYAPSATGITLIAAGWMLTLSFVSIAMLASVSTRDKARGIGIAILLWFLFTMIYDGFVLWILFAFNDYPLEKPVLVLTALNPVDLARIVLLLRIDISAFMGYTGALYKDYFGTAKGMIITTSVLLCWIIIPMLLAVRRFKSRDI